MTQVKSLPESGVEAVSEGCNWSAGKGEQGGLTGRKGENIPVRGRKEHRCECSAACLKGSTFFVSGGEE